MHNTTQVSQRAQVILRSINFWKLAITFLAAWYFFDYAMHPKEHYFIDGVNLIFHEAGHIIFGIFGNFVFIAGGSIFQVLVPLICSATLAYQYQYFSASLVLFWVGESIINVSIYAGDAIVMRLELLGGDNVGHDWHNMLSMLGLLSYTDIIAGIIYWAGVVVLCLAFIATLFTSRNTFVRQDL
jgi:hypothetical protein